MVTNSKFIPCPSHFSSEATSSNCSTASSPISTSTLQSCLQINTSSNPSPEVVTSDSPGQWVLARLWNAHSLKSKLSFFQSFIYSKSYDIFSVSETCLSFHTLENEILPTGYTIYHQDREGRWGGGVLVAVSNCFVLRPDRFSACVVFHSV